MQYGRPRTVGGGGFDSHPLRDYCPGLPNFCTIVPVFFLTHTSARPPACCTRLLPHTHCACLLSPCALFWGAFLGRGFGIFGSFFGMRFSVVILKSSIGEQLWEIISLTNNCFEKRRLWGIALENNFGKSFLEIIFGGSFSNCSEQLLIITLGNGFGK